MPIQLNKTASTTGTFDESIPLAAAVEVPSTVVVETATLASEDPQTISSSTLNAAYASVPPQLQELINRELEQDERVLRTAMPKPHFTPASKRALCSGIILTSFLVFGSVIGGLIVFLCSFPFLWIIVFLLALPFWQYRFLLNTIYVITDRRVITILCGGRLFTIHSFLPKDFTDIVRREYQDGTGDIIFFQDAFQHGFLRIQNAREIELMLRTLKEEASTSTTTRPSDFSNALSSTTLSTIDPLVPPQFQEIVNRELQGDERVLWTAMPKFPYLLYSPMFFLGLYGMTKMVYTMVKTSSSGPVMFFIMIVLTMAGIFFMVVPLWCYWNSRKTLYVITGRRAIVIRNNYSHTFPPYRSQSIFRREHQDGTGDVIISQIIELDSMRIQWLKEDGFFGIRVARDIEKMLKVLADQNNVP